jgi:hypothetical protein
MFMYARMWGGGVNIKKNYFNIDYTIHCNYVKKREFDRHYKLH